jgi:hypothetical protein
MRLLPLDKAVLLWGVVAIITYSLLWGNTSSFLYKCAKTIDSVGAYFVFRVLIKNIEDYKNALWALGISILILGIGMFFENLMHYNYFSKFFGVPAYSYIRNGRYRCQGTFAHPILTGNYGAITIALCMALASRVSKYRTLLAFVLLFAGVVTITAASSSAATVLLFVGFAYLIWFIRDKTKMIVWGSVLCLVVISFFMDAPIWYLIAKLGYLTGGTGWHRSYLIDQAIRYLKDWWLIGTQITAHWFPYVLSVNNRADITNQFIAEGVNGGLITMFLFIYMINRGFYSVGIMLRMSTTNVFLIWSLGVALVGHIAAFFSVSYYDKSICFFMFLLASIAALHSSIAAATPGQDKENNA